LFDRVFGQALLDDVNKLIKVLVEAQTKARKPVSVFSVIQFIISTKILYNHLYSAMVLTLHERTTFAAT